MFEQFFCELAQVELDSEQADAFFSFMGDVSLLLLIKAGDITWQAMSCISWPKKKPASNTSTLLDSYQDLERVVEQQMDESDSVSIQLNECIKTMNVYINKTKKISKTTTSDLTATQLQLAEQAHSLSEAYQFYPEFEAKEGDLPSDVKDHIAQREEHHHQVIDAAKNLLESAYQRINELKLLLDQQDQKQALALGF